MNRPKVLVLAHGIWYGGAQVSTIEFLRLARKAMDIHVVACCDASHEFICSIQALGLSISSVPYRRVHGYPRARMLQMASENLKGRVGIEGGKTSDE
jgi:hypothetical protein